MKFEIIEEQPQKDGSLILVCEYDQDFVEIYKKSTGRVRVTKRGIEKWMLAAIVRFMKYEETTCGNV